MMLIGRIKRKKKKPSFFIPETCVYKVKLLFFAKSRELVGQKEAEVELLSHTTTRGVLEDLVTIYPGLSVISETVVLSLNEEYLEVGNQQVTLRAGDELAVIPPISGG